MSIKKISEMDLSEMSKRSYLPPEALMYFESQAFELLWGWLEVHAPKHIVELFYALNTLQFLMRIPPEAYPVEGREQWNKEVRQAVGEVGWGIKAMGGNFGDFWCKGIANRMERNARK